MIARNSAKLRTYTLKAGLDSRADFTEMSILSTAIKDKILPLRQCMLLAGSWVGETPHQATRVHLIYYRMTHWRS